MPSAEPYLAGRLRKSITSQLRGQTGDLGVACILAVTLTRVQSDPNQNLPCHRAPKNQTKSRAMPAGLFV